ncbi:peptidase C15 [Tumidithrix helvetica PCC 7403]|uniref:pyroglutamyl-peptidase I family protein n=1 Tax=Tumidithrix helvetica TaxID=3457545 RepID=UPI003CC176B6
MTKKVLLTSFATWEAHQVSNSSDDLLGIVAQRGLLSDRMHLARQLPVDFELAPSQAIATIQQFKPDVVICCGMAEMRKVLTVELNAWSQEVTHQTKVNLNQLLMGLAITEISEDAGRYVCNTLYHCLLDYFHRHRLDIACIFVHVPILTLANTEAIAQDFLTILHRLKN